MARVLLGVSGGIAAYKAAELLRRLTESGHDVTVVPTPNALRFVGSATWEALSGHPVHTGVFDDVAAVEHVRLGRQADLVVVAPATADLLARAAAGRADDLLAGCLLTATCPVLFAPAMHTEMWSHPATRDAVATLRRRGAMVIDPASGRLTGADSGAGRLPEPSELADIVRSVLERPEITDRASRRDLAGLRVAVSAGGTREAIDPVRFLSNASSGRMGISLARAAVLRGAETSLIAAGVGLPAPAGARLTEVVSTEDLRIAMIKEAADSDVVVMAAAPSDFRPAEPAQSKIKKSSADSGLQLSLVQNPDVLAELAGERVRPGQLVVGFAAETADDPEELLALGREKLRRKGCDLLVLNAVGGGRVFGRSESEIRLLTPGGDSASAPISTDPIAGSKDALAHAIWDAVLALAAGPGNADETGAEAGGR